MAQKTLTPVLEATSEEADSMVSETSNIHQQPRHNPEDKSNSSLNNGHGSLHSTIKILCFHINL